MVILCGLIVLLFGYSVHSECFNNKIANTKQFVFNNALKELNYYRNNNLIPNHIGWQAGYGARFGTTV
jgi:hypothetical protein